MDCQYDLGVKSQGQVNIKSGCNYYGGYPYLTQCLTELSRLQERFWIPEMVLSQRSMSKYFSDYIACIANILM